LRQLAHIPYFKHSPGEKQRREGQADDEDEADDEAEGEFEGEGD
jgi:hypothetical protein